MRQQGSVEETLSGIVARVTYHDRDSGWSVLKVAPFDQPNEVVPVTVHQCQVFAGATMDFTGAWTEHPKYGRQFKARHAVERKPASAAALEQYLGSGLIRGVGPKTARKIVKHFGADTLDVFESDIGRLLEVPGIAQRKLETISQAWAEHRAVREVMMFLQTHGISTLFAVRIFKEYGHEAIERVSENPYRLADDFYGIGFFSADKVALSLGVEPGSAMRVAAGIKHVLSAAREQGHCYLRLPQIVQGVNELLELPCDERTAETLALLERRGELRTRRLPDAEGQLQTCYYAKSLYRDEDTCARQLKRLLHTPLAVDEARVERWLDRYAARTGLALSAEQRAAVAGIVRHPVSILTGGPGCGKTTATKTLVALLHAMKQRVLLAAPTGRAAQRMAEVIGVEAKTLHRLLVWEPATGGFRMDEACPLEADAVVVDECSMLDVSLAASLLRAVPPGCRLVLVGDADQLPSVGAGNVLRDLIDSGRVPCFRLTEVFRQAARSQIVQFAHRINRGEVPQVDSPIRRPELWRGGSDCLFVDAEEATQEQARFIGRAKRALRQAGSPEDDDGAHEAGEAEAAVEGPEPLVVPRKFAHVDLDALARTRTGAEELRAVLKQVHPWSSLHYGLDASGMVRKLVDETVPRYLGTEREVQVLSPMTRGSLGTHALNRALQARVNPPGPGKPALAVGEKVLRQGDRVIQRRNNYDLEVFNGDIGIVAGADTEALRCRVRFGAGPGAREVDYERDALSELELAYAVTIHKAQGSEFDVVVLPLLTQHYKMLYRNLVYTGLTRAKRLAVFVGSRRALALAVRTGDARTRQTALRELLCENA